MKVLNVHERELAGDGASALEELEQLWPKRWPVLTDDGVGFLRHESVEHVPGQKRIFRITSPHGLVGTHGWELHGSTLRHTVEADLHGAMLFGWPLVVHPIHDAMHEDVLDSVAGRPPRPLSRRVRVLRSALRRLA
jgi:hypothetical protein